MIFLLINGLFNNFSFHKWPFNTQMFSFFFLSIFIKSLNNFDLSSPFHWNSPYQIKNWAFYGITNLKDSLKFDQDKSRNLSVSCSLLPINSSNFDITFQFSLKSGTFYFIYSNEDCPSSYFYNMDDYSFSDGFILKFYKAQKNKTAINISFHNNENINLPAPVKIGEFDENDENDEKNNIRKDAISLRITKNTNQLSFNVFNCKQNQKGWKLVKTFEEKIINFGFFSFFGIPSSSDIGDQNLFSFEMKEPTIDDSQSNDHQLNKNLKIFKSKLGIYYSKKKQLFYSSKIDIKENLTENQKQKQNQMNEEATKMMFHILSEITERAKLGLNETEFETLLELSAVIKLVKSKEKITKRRAVLDEISKHIDDIKSSLIKNLTSLTKTVSDEMKEIEETGFDELKKIMPKVWEGNSVVNEVIKRKKETKKKLSVNLILLMISVIETVLFVIFFIYKRHKTKDFRKID